jgi:hypothetical protein
MKYEAVKLFMGLIFSGHVDIKNVQEELISEFGNIDFESEIIDFNYTDYYFPEMGEPLFRKFISFEKLIYPGKLASIKNITCEIEKKFAKNQDRRDILSLQKLCLHQQRIFFTGFILRKGYMVK